MKTSILEIKGVTKLSKKELKTINGADCWDNWDFCEKYFGGNSFKYFDDCMRHLGCG